jgi:molecular chaperone IbpA
MRRFDLAPLFRSSIGFDHLAAVMDQLASVDGDNGFPPYNIERLGENEYRITMAVAGFSIDDLGIEVKESTLAVRGEKQTEAGDREFLHRGIAARNFERRFRLADHVEVTGATLENGFLHVELKREIPEAMKPRSIKIGKPAQNGAASGEPQNLRISA